MSIIVQLVIIQTSFESFMNYLQNADSQFKDTGCGFTLNRGGGVLIQALFTRWRYAHRHYCEANLLYIYITLEIITLHMTSILMFEHIYVITKFSARSQQCFINHVEISALCLCLTACNLFIHLCLTRRLVLLRSRALDASSMESRSRRVVTRTSRETCSCDSLPPNF